MEGAGITPGTTAGAAPDGSTHGRIVVGIDGSAPSKAALRWAVGQAGLTGAHVHAVAAWEYPSLYGWFAPMTDGGFERSALRTLTAEVNEVVGRDRPVEIRESLVLGHAAEVLLGAAEGADLLVLGSRGRGSFTRTLLGSVSARCAVHGVCPVVIVRADGTASAPPHTARAVATVESGGESRGESRGEGRGEGRGEATVRTKDWQLSLHVVEDGDTTRVHAVLDADGSVLHSDALARRNPVDDPAPAVGDDFAVGRALVDLGHQLLRAGTRSATGPAERAGG
ncbi:universal stress protein [Kitasatospora sp. NPDC056181]|uniref:universal stress protein n=1 Tax=Kitasatospora sp. NPDC056181 TaxID=3345737 RepID=UPI0035DF0021